MNFIITGATGFIGQNIITQLLRDNHYIVALVRPTSKYKLQTHSHIKLLEGNLTEITQKHLPYPLDSYHLIHLAWDDLPNYHSMVHLESHLIQHYFFIKRLIQQGVKNITITGTCFEYGLQNGPLTEETQTNPQNPYAMAKDFLHKMLQQLSFHIPFQLKWLRLWYMFGKGQNAKSLLAQLQQAIDSGADEFAMSKGEQLRDYLPVEQVASLIIKSAINNSFTGTLNICSGSPVSINSVVENYLSQTNQTIKLNKGAYPYNTYEPMAFWGDNKKLLQLTRGGGVTRPHHNPATFLPTIPLFLFHSFQTSCFSSILTDRRAI